MREECLLQIKNALTNPWIPHNYVGVIPYDNAITTDGKVSLNGKDFIPYGSTLFVNLAKERGWKGLHFDLDQFNYKAALANRTDMLNSNVMRLDDAIVYLKTLEEFEVFTRPSQDLKQFAGLTIRSDECAKWFQDMISCEFEGSYRQLPSMEVVVSPIKPIQAEWRWFIVNRKIITGSMYRAHNQMRKERVREQALIDEAQYFADQWLPDDSCVMDLALVDNVLKVIEFNCINASGFYDCDVPAIFKALWGRHRGYN